MADLMKWKPFHSLMRDFFDDLDPFFKDRRSLMGSNFDFSPRMDLKETDDELQLLVDTPGMQKKDIDISVDDGVLTVKGERKEQDERTTKEGYVHTERYFGTFERRVRLPENVDIDNLKAEYNDGVLTVKAPKKEIEKPETKKIEVT